MTVTVYGDSILKGVLYIDGHYSIERGWTERLARKYGLELRNRSHLGCTLDKGLARLESDLARGDRPGDWAVVGFGGNDCDFDWDAVAAEPEGEHLCKVPPERFCALYRRAIHLVREAGARPVLVSPPPIDPERYLNHICRAGRDRARILAWLGGVNTIYRWQEWYARLAEGIAAEESALLVDLRSPFLARRRLDGLLCEDGIHPSRQGQELIFESFCAAADRELARKATA